jgi:hypothetical protein
MRIGMNTSDEYLELALRHGIVRAGYQVVPDSAWQQVYAAHHARQMPTPPRISDSKIALLLEAGRVQIMPLSHFWPFTEKALVVMEPAAWSPDERSRILGLLQSGRLATDFIVLVNGSAADRQQVAAAIHAP